MPAVKPKSSCIEIFQFHWWMERFDFDYFWLYYDIYPQKWSRRRRGRRQRGGQEKKLRKKKRERRRRRSGAFADCTVNSPLSASWVGRRPSHELISAVSKCTVARGKGTRCYVSVPQRRRRKRRKRKRDGIFILFFRHLTLDQIWTHEYARVGF